MQYFISFLEGIITFISPCILPMLPVYLTYFAGGKVSGKSGKALRNSIGFVLGFTVIFVLMGALAGAIGGFLTKYRTAVDAITGLIVVLFGLNFLGVLKINLFRGMKGKKSAGEMGFFASILFGVVFSVGWTPCVGAFLGSALAMASGQGSTFAGVLMLLVFSLGLGIPFIISAVLIDKLKGAFNFIKKNYKVINIICGIFLIVVGVLMMTGLFGRFVGFLS
ncbi:MAG: cytochrome c biogenesis protein CcdA [Ruminococcaceae bacterium]|nr:cytochrome c biogenesis protein CcdA [Oscillospiraceae bacterium]